MKTTRPCWSSAPTTSSTKPKAPAATASSPSRRGHGFDPRANPAATLLVVYEQGRVEHDLVEHACELARRRAIRRIDCERTDDRFLHARREIGDVLARRLI